MIKFIKKVVNGYLEVEKDILTRCMHLFIAIALIVIVVVWIFGEVRVL